MFCENCGTKLEEGVKFCPACGTKAKVIEETPVVDTPAVEEPTVLIEETPVITEPAPAVEEIPETATEPVEEVVPEAVPEIVPEVVPAAEPPIGMAPVAHVVPPEVQVPNEAVTTPAPAAKKASSTGALVFGILGFVFSDTGLLGLILSIIGCVKANKFAIMNGRGDGKSKAGKVLSIIGLVFSIISTALIIAVAAFVVYVVVNGDADNLLRALASGGELSLWL